MAKVTNKTEEVTEVVLTLTREEADTLFTLTGRVGGDRKGPRGVIDKVFQALGKVGAKSVGYTGLVPSIIRWNPKEDAGVQFTSVFNTTWQ